MYRRGEDTAVENAAVWTDAELVKLWLPPRKPDGHKGDFGRVLIAGGAVGYTGAPILAARGALRTGAGLVSVAVPESIYRIAAVKCDEAMPTPLPDRDGQFSRAALPPLLELLSGKDAALLGPGMGRGEGVEQLVCGVMAGTDLPLVVDADGINALARHMNVLDAARGRSIVLTPHEGEFARLGGDLSGGDRLGSARRFAQEHGCVLVLKGRRTVTALPDGKCYVNQTGNSGMAVGGCGDVLAGMILSLMGQGLDAGRAAVCAVWLHGRAGDLAAADKGKYGMLPGDLIECLPYAIKPLEQ